ncbi:energy transducer TonB [Chitinophaga pendula]|uniref:energy transducer TonB n=1 Tax=Chitinophaga TaxID=79328 RepID=UPI000BAF81D9|nr:MULTISPECIES: energy transducer TonB [Chitinophaga]ASZ11037.1 energy transducer TonB [Chitinophaga sp. MD30]UCJ05966.1 energy transducer TonB [Chitinophaga pendula]
MNTTKNSQKEFLDILFNGRNKDYGAYDLRVRYDKRVRNAIATMASFALVILAAYSFSSRSVAATVNTKAIVNEVILDDLKMPEAKLVPPPPPPPATPPPALKPTIRVTTPRIVEDQQVAEKEQPPRMDEIIKTSVSTVNAAGNVNGIDPDMIPDIGKGAGTGVVSVPTPAKEENDHPFTFVEQMPAFPGGEEALMKYLLNNTTYPHIAMENGIEGTVYVGFVVDREGNVIDVRLAGQKKGGGLDEEAVRVIQKMPKWKPGKQNGRAVAVVYSLPVKFKLEQ